MKNAQEIIKAIENITVKYGLKVIQMDGAMGLTKPKNIKFVQMNEEEVRKGNFSLILAVKLQGKRKDTALELYNWIKKLDENNEIVMAN